MIASLEYNVPVISETEDLQFLLQNIQPPNTTTGWDYSVPRSFTLHQVKEDFQPDARTIGYVIGVVPWNTFFRNLLPDDINGIVVNIVSDCGKIFTYTVNGGKDDISVQGDAHDPKYDDLKQQYAFFWKTHANGTARHCHFDLHIYPNQEFEDQYRSNAPVMYTGIVVAVFVFAAIVLFSYDRRQKRIQTGVLQEKAQAEAIVDSLFPKFVKRRLLAEQQLNKNFTSFSRKDHRRRKSTAQISDFLSGDLAGGLNCNNKPMADLYPFATIMFADIVGEYSGVHG